MAYKQYTSCVQPNHYVDFGANIVGISNAILLVLTAGFVAFAVIAIAGGPVAITIAIALVTAIIVFLNWWLYGRLICLGDDPRNCAIFGMVLGQGPSDPSLTHKFGDNDYTMNLLLAPTNDLPDTPLSDFWAAPEGYLVTPNPAVLAIGKGYSQTQNIGHLKYLHCEFEGDGIRKLLDAFYGVLATLLLSLLVPGLWIVSIIIFLLAFLGGIVFGSPGEPGSGTPLDVDPNLGSLSVGDVVVVQGEWIYDSGHTGWNEIHPVRACQIIGHLEKGQTWSDFAFTDMNTGTVLKLDTPANVELFRAFWCGALTGANGAETGGNRDDPSQGWGIHPLVDGCKPPDIIL